MRFEILGPLRVLRGDQDVTPTGRMQRILLSLLLAQANDYVSVDVLCDALWNGEANARAAARLQLLVHRLRGILDTGERLSNGPLGYRLHTSHEELDSAEFDELATESTPAQARLALDLWRGTPFQDVDAPSLEAARSHWSEVRLIVLQRLFESELEAGRHASIVAELDAVAHAHPLNEHLQALLVTALYRGGRTNEALDVFRRTRTQMVDELGIEPGPELANLQERVLAGDPDEPTGPAHPIPRQLPPRTTHLMGREDDLAHLDELMGARGPGHPERSEPTGQRTCVVTGTAGIGKTSLAVHWAYEHRAEFPDGQLYVDLRGFSTDDPAEPVDVLASLIRGVGGDKSALAPDVSDRAALFRSLIDGKRLLLVLDNARSVEQVRPLLPGASGCSIVITSREALTGLVIGESALSLTLEKLSPDASINLLARYAGDWVREDAKACSRLAEHCAFLPLALRIAAEQARTRPERDVATLVAEIANEESRLDVLDLGGDPRTEVRAVFSWSYESLPTDAAKLFRIMGLLPGRDADVDALSALCGLDARTTLRNLAVLKRAHLVDEGPARRYCQHDLLKAYAAELALEIDHEIDRRHARSRLIAYYSYIASIAMIPFEKHDAHSRPTVEPVECATPTFDGNDAALAWLDAERSNIVALIRVADDDDGRRVVELAQTLLLYFGVQGHLDDAVRVQSAALAHSKRLEDTHGESNAERALGTLRAASGDLEGAVPPLNRSVELCRAIGDSLGEAAALNNLGEIASVRGQAMEAVQLHRQSLAINRASDDKVRIALNLSNIGNNLRRAGADDEALAYLLESLELCRLHEFGRVRGIAARGLTKLYEERNEFDAALVYGEEALEAGRTAHDPSIEGDALKTIGTIYRRRGEPDAALRCFESALLIARRIGSITLIAASLEGIARVQALGDPRAALPLFGEAIDLMVKHDQPSREARMRVGLADAHEALGEPELALPLLHDALRLYERLEDRRADELRVRLADTPLEHGTFRNHTPTGS